MRKKEAVMHRDILIIADIEGSSLCTGYEASSFMTAGWASACTGMSLDVSAVAVALFNAGARSITVKDFHRTAYNILPELLDKRVRLIQGYKAGPVPGIGDPGTATALVMLGMHAPSGSNGFLAHTLTSRLGRIIVNGKLLGEAELFSASLASFGIAPVFFSGCPVACSYAEKAIPGVHTFPAMKSDGGELIEDVTEWRNRLALAALHSLDSEAGPFSMQGPFSVSVTMRDGIDAARKIAGRWKLDFQDDTIFFSAPRFNDLYTQLIKICYLTPSMEKILPAGLFIYDLAGRFGRTWARRRIKAMKQCG